MSALATLPIDQGSWNATGATSTSYKLTSYRASAPGAGELPLAFVIVPTITNGLNATITASWGATAYQIWDMSTNARVTAGVIVANRPVQLIFDGTKFWVVGAAAIVHGSAHLMGGADPIPTDTSPTNGSTNLITSNAVYGVSARVTSVEGTLPNKADLTGGKVNVNQTTSVVSTKTASYTLALADAGTTILMNVATANNLTVPPNSSVALPIGTEIQIAQKGAGATTIVAGSGVTIRSLYNMLKLLGQYAGVHLKKVDTDEWYAWGAMQ